MATRRMMQPSPRSQFHGNSAKVQRLPVTLSTSPPTFSMPRTPFLNRMRWTGSQSGKSSFQSRPPDHALHSSARCGCSGPLRCGPMAVAAGGGEGMVVGLGVVADDLDLFLDEPLARRRHEAGRAAEIVLAVLVDLVPAGVHDDDVARAYRRAGGLFEIVVGDRLPLLLRN